MNLTCNEYEVIVVGGGVAGGAAAIALAKSGVSVLLLEKEQSPGHKVCGEFLSGESQPLLQEIGVDVNALGAVDITQFHLYSGERPLRVRLPFVGKSISRKLLDQNLLMRAQEVGAKVLFAAHAKSIRMVDGGFQVETTQGTFLGRDVFWAAGKSDTNTVLKRQLKRQSQESDQDFIGFKRHLEVPREIFRSLQQTIELHVYNGGYAGISQIENDRLNYCFLIEKKISKRLDHSWHRILAHQAENNPRLKELFARAEWLWQKPLSIANIPYGYVCSQEKSPYFILGDQFAVISSLAGDGMSMALLSAREAALSYIDGKQKKLEMDEVIGQYNLRMQAAFSSPVAWGYRLQRLFAYPQGLKFALRLLEPFPWIAEKIVHRTRCAELGTDLRFGFTT